MAPIDPVEAGNRHPVGTEERFKGILRLDEAGGPRDAGEAWIFDSGEIFPGGVRGGGAGTRHGRRFVENCGGYQNYQK
jgi:hypothetical protein